MELTLALTGSEKLPHLESSPTELHCQVRAYFLKFLSFKVPKLKLDVVMRVCDPRVLGAEVGGRGHPLLTANFRLCLKGRRGGGTKHESP